VLLASSVGIAGARARDSLSSLSVMADAGMAARLRAQDSLSSLSVMADAGVAARLRARDSLSSLSAMADAGMAAGMRAQDCSSCGSMAADSGAAAGPGIAAVERVHPLLEAAALFLFPKILQDGVLLKDYVRSEEFRRLRDQDGDLVAVDGLFRRGLQMSWNNPYVTLLIVAAAVLDHQHVGVRLPLIGPLLWFPLTSEFAEQFAERHDALPSRLFGDTPAEGDRDKLQHFFGSALMAVGTESLDAAERIGSFVEWGEEKFVVGGSVDPRDIECNRRGARFGLAFLEDRAALPSTFMRTPLCTVLPDSVLLQEEHHP